MKAWIASHWGVVVAGGLALVLVASVGTWWAIHPSALSQKPSIDCVLCTTVQSTVENVDMFTDWDGYNARKYAEAQAQQALFAGGPGAVWDAITKPIVDDWANNPGHALGGTIGTVGTFAIPGGAALKGLRGVKAAEEAVTAGAKTGVTIGRDMAGRVIPFAQKNGMSYYKGTPGWVPRKAIERVSPSALDKTDMWFNKRWIDKQMSGGNRITDIGEPPRYQPSSFYNMELERTSGYWNYFRDPQP